MTHPTPIAGPSPGPPRRKGEQTAERILDSAEILFAEHGYAGTTLRDVATAVDLRIPSLYNHFDSKEQLYAAVLDRGIGPVIELLSELVEAPTSQRVDAASVLQRIMDLLSEHPHLPQLLLHESLGRGQRLTPMLRDRIAPIFAKAQTIVESREGTHRWERDQLPLLVLALYNTVVGFHGIAPLYEALTGANLMSPELRARQTRFMTEMVEILLPEPPVPAEGD
jgi:AcrR family transcriptional regulator